MGGTVSLLATALRPDLVKGLVLADPVIMPQTFRLFAQAARLLGLYDRVLPMVQQAERRRARWPSPEAAFLAYKGRGAFRTWPEKTVRDYLEGGLTADLASNDWMLSCAPQWEAANYRAGPPNVWPLLQKIRVPVVLLTAGQRSTCPVPVARALQARVKTLKWRLFPECTHFLPMERPDTVAESLQRVAE
jgi:pimeloyl-ACP methyl ester carboxylesterase